MRENKLRLRAERLGFRLQKSGQRDRQAPDYARFMIVDGVTRVPVAGLSGTGKATMTTDEVERWLDSRPSPAC